MSAKVYLVTSGSYSDYSVRRVFARRADALAYIAERSDGYSDWNDVDEWDVTESAPGVTPTWYAGAYITSGGEIVSSASSGRKVWEGSDGDDDRVPKRARVTVREADFPHARALAGTGALQVQVVARSEAAASKALWDRAYRLSAERKGVA